MTWQSRAAPSQYFGGSERAKWAIGVVVCGLLIAVAYLWIDRPVAYFVYHELRPYRAMFDVASRLPKLIGPLLVASALLLAILAAMKRRLTTVPTVVLLSALSLAFSDIPENWLKFAFGSTWPETWVQNNPSLIRDGVHSFNPFHGGPGYASFPSGHMTAICAMMSVFWLCWPPLRPICALAIAVTFVGLLGANYHFVSDLMAGGLLGSLIGWVIVMLWNAGAHPIGIKSTAPPNVSGNVAE